MSHKICYDRVTLEIPGSWQSEERRASVAIYRTMSGQGAINISKLELKRGHLVDRNGLIEMLAELNVKARQIDPWETITGAAYGEKEVNGRFWRYWLLPAGGIAVLVSYNRRCENFDEEENRDVDRILHSMRLISEDAASRD